MRPLFRLKSCLTGLLALSMMACGEVAPPDYQGEPVASVRGQLTAAESTTVDGPVRLALAWYPLTPDSGLVSSKPKSIVTQEVEYTGSFPINYTFNLFGPPSAGALNNLPQADGTANKMAVGMVLAYRDGNGNGKLDTIAANGTGVDKVLGVSLDFGYFQPTASLNGFYLVYSDVARPKGEEDPVALQAGYNLVRVSGPLTGTQGPTATVEPLTTQVPIALTGKPELALHVCEALYSPSTVIEVDPDGPAPTLCGVELPVTPVPGLPSGVTMSLSLAMTDGTPDAQAMVQRYEEGEEVPTDVNDAQVSVNGVAFTYDAEMRGYRPSAPLSFTLGAAVTMSLKSGDTQRTYQVTLPPDFTITSPSSGAEVPSGEPLSVTWTSGSAEWMFSATLLGDNGWYLGSAFNDGNTLTIDTEPYLGAAQLQVNGSAFTHTQQGDHVMTSVTHTLPLTFVE